MRTWMRQDFAVGAALGLALAGASACDGIEASRGGGGSTTTSTTTTITTTTPGTGGDNVACASLALADDARLSPTSGPVGAQWKGVAATPTVVLATTGQGLHRSKDGGQTWSFVRAAEVRGKDILAMAALGADLFVAMDAQLFVSRDDGDTWQDVSHAGSLFPSYLSVRGGELYMLDGGKPYVWRAAEEAWSALGDTDQFFDVIESDGTYVYANSLYAPGVYRYRLDDPSALWVKVDALPEWGYRAFAFLPGHGFAANASHVFHSTDDGKTWNKVTAMVDAVDFLTVGDSVFAASTSGLQVSSDGTTWTKQSVDAMFTSGFALATDGNRVFAATLGLHRQDAAGAPWTKLQVLGDYVARLVATQTSVFSFTTNGAFRTADSGATWSTADANNSANYFWSDPLVRHGDKLFGLDAQRALLSSTDDGATFTSTPLPPSLVDKNVTLLASTGKALVVGVMEGAGAGCTSAQDFTMSLYRSTDGGGTWSSGENNLPITFTDCYGVSYPPAVTALAQHGNALLATSWHDGAFRSTDDGATWQSMGKLRGFVSQGDTVFAAAEKGVSKSLDGGATWAPSGLDGLDVSALAVASNLLFASVGAAASPTGAIYVSADAGATWAQIDASFDAPITSLAVLGHRLFAGTRDQSVWSLDLPCSG